MGGMQWGNVAEWVAAVGTVGAFGATYWLIRSEVRARQEDRKVPALSMSVSVETQSFANLPHPTATVWVHNGSVLPMRQVEVTLYERSAPAEHRFELGELGPDRRDDVGVDLGSTPGPGELSAMVRFVDPWGNRWERENNGDLYDANPT